jgi:hypothetical protein
MKRFPNSLDPVRYFYLLLISLCFSGCATMGLLESTSSSTETPTTLSDAYSSGNRVVVVYKADLLNEFSRNIKFVKGAVLFSLPQEIPDHSLTGEKLHLEGNDSRQDQPIDTEALPIHSCQQLEILNENDCDDVSNRDDVFICGRSPDAFKIKTPEGWYHGKIEKQLVKEERPIERVALFPFAVAVDIAASPVYLVGGVLTTIYVGIMGDE